MILLRIRIQPEIMQILIMVPLVGTHSESKVPVLYKGE
jgi:hypothetical protein